MEKQNFNLKSYLAATKPVFEIIPEENSVISLIPDHLSAIKEIGQEALNQTEIPRADGFNEYSFELLTSKIVQRSQQLGTEELTD